MRKIIVSMFVSLDGVMEAPNEWSLNCWSEDQGQFKFAELAASDALLLGRVTYEGFAAAWPHMTEQAGAYADMMNSYPKYVVSSTLTELEWNNSHRLNQNIAQEVEALKQQPGKDIIVFGSAELIQTLMQHDLIDEYRLLIYPIVVGKGKHLFALESAGKGMKLVESKIFTSGVAALTYQPTALA